MKNPTSKDVLDTVQRLGGEARLVERTQAMLDVIHSGYAGVLPSGKIVDRREYSDAIPIPKNEMLGVPEPHDG